MGDENKNENQKEKEKAKEKEKEKETLTEKEDEEEEDDDNGWCGASHSVQSMVTVCQYNKDFKNKYGDVKLQQYDPHDPRGRWQQ